jgi:putative ABC transport system permease protein
MTSLLQDLGYAIRALRRTPALSLVVVASLAIGIGANTAIFSVVNALLLKPLPYPDPDRLAVLWLRSPGINIPQDWPSPGQFIDVRSENRSFEEMSISRGSDGALLTRDEAQRVEGIATSSSLFRLLGARPLYGRLLRTDEDTPGQPAVVVLSYGFWKRAFNADPNVIGTSVTLNGFGPGGGDTKNQFEIVGVLRREFLLNAEVMPTVASIQQIDVFVPLPLAADAVNRRGDENYNLMARLKPGVTMAQAHDDVAAVAARIREKDHRDRTFTIDVVPLVESVVGNVRVAVLVVLGSVALVLLIACANVANLLLTRATSRQKEIAVRTALGASWKRLARQLLTESVLLGLLGGAAGLAIAKTALLVVRTINPGNIPRLEAITLDGTVLVFTLAVSIGTGILFGLAPALRAAHVDLNTSLKAGGRSAQGEGGLGSSRRRVRSVLVVAEVAISLMLLIGAGLLVRSFVRLQRVPPGFDPEGVISMRVGRARQAADRTAALEFYRAAGAALASTPGVASWGAVTSLPFTSSVGWGTMNIEGWTPQPGQELQVDQRGATPDYFKTMQIPLVKGRFFTDADSQTTAQPVAIIDEKFAQRFWPAGDAIGKHVWNDPARKLTIIGVVGTVKQYGLDVDGRLVVYRPSAWASYQVARTSLPDPASVARDLVRKIQDIDPTAFVFDVQTMPARMSASLARQRFSTLMLGSFAVFALILAIVGVYGVMSHLVAQGTHDIGVRMALGAERSRILRMVLMQGLQLTVAGTIIGLAGAAALTRVMASLLFGVSTIDAVTFSAVPLVLIATAMLASYIPARRATRVDPVVALRDE